MARRRAGHGQHPAAEVADVIPVSARVAWAYLAVVLSSVAAAVLVVLLNQTLAAVVCDRATAGDDPVASCRIGIAIWAGLGGFLLCLAPAVRLLKLDWWLWSAMLAAAGLLVATDAVTEWWWWGIAALVPAVAALASADWARGRTFRRAQLALILALDAVAAAALVWWYLKG